MPNPVFAVHARRIAFACCLLIAASLAQAATQAAGVPQLPRNLFAAGTPQMYWLAHVEADPMRQLAARSRVLARPLGAAAGRFATLATLQSRIVAVSHLNGRAILALDDGQLLSLWPNGSAALPPPPAAHVLALAGDDTSGRLYAVLAIATPHSPPAAPIARHAGIGVLEPAGWRVVADLPDADAQHAFAADLDSAGQLIVAERGGESVRVSRVSSDHAQPLATLPISAASAGFGFAGDANHTAAWAANIDGSVALQPLPTRDGEQPGAAVHLPPGQASPPGEIAVVAANGLLRRVRLGQGNALVEQPFDWTGRAAGAELPVEAPPTPPSASWQAAQGVIVATLIWAIVGSMRRRPALRRAIAENRVAVPAPLGPRLLAGAIDLFPFAGGCAILLLKTGQFNAAAVNAAQAGAAFALPEAIAAAAYVLYTIAVEAAFGRSVGKLILGLRVVRVDGGRPTVIALITRNFLRIIDVVLVFPALLLLLPPLRQRAGDSAAGTVVASDTPTANGEDDDAESGSGEAGQADEPPAGEA